MANDLSRQSFPERSIAPAGEPDAPLNLRRELSVLDLVIYGMVYMLPIAPFALYGIIANVSHGMVPLVYLVSVVAMMFTARSYQVLSKQFPVAGSAYTYAQNGIGDLAGFLAGWLVFLDYIIAPGLLAVVSAVAMNSLVPEIPRSLWILGFVGLGTVLNLVGVSVTAKVNQAFLVVMLVVLAAFVGVGLFALYVGGKGHGALTLGSLFDVRSFTWAGLGTGILIGSTNFLGFDAITTLGEEVKSRQRHLASFAGMATLVITAVLFVLQTWIAADLAPGARLLSPDSAFYDISAYAGGHWLFALTSISTAVAFGVPCTIVCQMAIARIIFAMGRDRQLPKVFSRLSRKSRQPYVANLFVATVSLVIALAFQDRLDDLALFQNFGAFSAFILVNLSVIGYFRIRQKSRDLWNHLILPAVGCAVIVALMVAMRAATLRMGLVWLGLGLAYYLVIRYLLGRRVELRI
ncbi:MULTISPECIES: APC family permease [unclassified Burkholderia]|uniref:APC family permease n=1 Tax=unclassified Burkholderia TaxID=2613784 RepID=UPI000469F537|nr:MULTISPECIES: APC family permease [unclassified Burkholderia]NIE85705.1 APC family permease [Burkholderia sp. Tr-860]NIF66022.1 APC family permease [Burkholderia sp. Cy-647]NIF72676.1 APC family permease [Burkholderia sp. Ap-962]NIF89824.1 APC family permease [Burkholderia sp. Cy-637]NIF96233.1 APC family permease [Burkholderia sp. Ax-1720]